MRWKTYTAAGIVGLIGALHYFQDAGVCDGCEKLADSLEYLAGMLGLIGIRHALAKIEKSNRAVILAAVLGAAAAGAGAQTTIDIEAGGAFAPSATPRASGYFGFCAGGEQTRTCSVVEARPIGTQGVTFAFSQRVERSIISDPRLELLGFAGLGIGTSEDATGGIFQTGGALKVPIRGGLYSVSSGGFEKSPLSGNEGWAATGIRYRFGQ